MPFSATAAINACRALAEWASYAAVAADRRRATPLFCGVGGLGTPASQADLDNIFSRMMAYVCGGKDAAAAYSMHSWRAWLASAMAAAGVPDIHIQAALRWASTEALAEYNYKKRDGAVRVRRPPSEQRRSVV